jgi:glycosyltransferase involved in cell wall biosynthesis
MKILVVTAFYPPAWATGGVARASGALTRELARLGHDVVVATTRWSSNDPAHEDLNRIRVHRFEGPRWLRERLFPWPHGLAAYLAQDAGTFDIAHLAGHRTGLAFVAWRALRRARVPYVLQPHGTYPHHAARHVAKALVDALFGTALVRQAAALLAVSQAEARDLPRPAHVAPNGIDDVGAAERMPRAAAPRLLFVGNDAPQKRGRELAALLGALPEVCLTLVGSFGQAFRRAFHPFGPRVEFRGVLASEALAAAYASADLLVQPAVGEAFGLAPFEAALRGTATVVAGGHGSGEWFGRAGGCVVAPGEPRALRDAVLARLDQPELARREAAAVADFARRELSWPKIAHQIEALYRSVLAARRGISDA